MKKTFLPLVVGNWKMNPQTVDMATRLATDIKKIIARVDGVEIVLVPPTLYLGAVHKVRSGSKVFALGAQNTHWEKLGAHTGEVSLPMLVSMDVSHVIIGHSERRRAGEKDEEVNKKMHATIKAGMTPIVCVGEWERDHAAHYLTFVEKQIRSAVNGVSKAKLDHVVIAYEPVWAIGTGNTATPEDVHEMKLFIQKVLVDIYGRTTAQKVRILYGGSVNGNNAESLMQQGLVDGFLVGGASLSAEEFKMIITKARVV
jgi:triosephosphate isomerase